MNDTLRTKPAVRFPDYDDEWNTVSVKDIFELTRGKVLASSKTAIIKTDEYRYPVYSSQTKNNGLMGYYNEYLYENAITWTTDGANAGDVNYRSGKFYCTNVCGVLISGHGYANKAVAESLNRISRNYVSYVGNPKLMNGVMSMVKISLPALPEQLKISDFLTAVDERIALQEKKIELLEKYKKGVMQQIFSQKIRFKDEDGKDFPEWKNSTIASLTKVVVGGTPSTNNSKFWGGSIGWLSSGDLKNGYVYRPSKYITEEGMKRSATVLMPKDTVLLAMTGATLGKIGYLTFECTGNQSVAGFIPSDKYSSRYLFYCLYVIQNQIFSLAAGAAQAGISKSSMEKLKIDLPSMAEQNVIADFLTSIDVKIELEFNELKISKQFKKGLLQQMFV